MESEKMDSYLRDVREKMSELSTMGLKPEDDIKLAIILNGLQSGICCTEQDRNIRKGCVLPVL